MNLKGFAFIVAVALAVAVGRQVAHAQLPPPSSTAQLPPPPSTGQLPPPPPNGQLPPPPLGRGDDTPNVSPLEIQRMFDAYALVQAQDRLKLSDEQFPQFLARFKVLQEVRRRSQMERMRTLRELNRLSQAEKLDESAVKDQLHSLQEIDSRTSAEVRKAYDSIDQVLDVRQQASFRLFEEMMERRKIELVTRARQNYRPKPRQ